MRPLLAIAALAVSCVAPGAVFAQADWPNRPVRIVVNGGPGSVGDVTSRLLAEHFAQTFGQPFVVDNRPGANGALGSEYVANQRGDGHTLLLSYTAAHVVNPHLHTNAKYSPRDFEPIAQVGALGTVLLVQQSSGVKSLPEFIDWLKARQGQSISYGSWGIGSGGHLSMEALLQKTGLKMTHVPYRTLSIAVNDMAGGRIDALFIPLNTGRPLLDKGVARAIAVTGPRRMSELPEVKTMTEQGVPFDLVAWYGLFAPAGTPPEVVNKLNAEVRRLLANPDLQPRWQKLGLADGPLTTPAEFGRRVSADSERWGEIVRRGNIKID